MNTAIFNTCEFIELERHTARADLMDLLHYNDKNFTDYERGALSATSFSFSESLEVLSGSSWADVDFVGEWNFSPDCKSYPYKITYHEKDNEKTITHYLTVTL